jgi:hypothetical protein
MITSASRPWIVVLGALALASSLCAQEPASLEERRRILRVQQRPARDTQKFLSLPKAPDRDFDFGGWFTYASLDLRDDDHAAAVADTTRTLILTDARLWSNGQISDDFKYYVRLRTWDFDLDVLPGTTPSDLRQQEGLELDQAYLDWHIGNRVDGRFGRQFVSLGRGIALAADLDAGVVEYADAEWHHRLAAGRSLRRDPGIDTSIIGFDKGAARQVFYLAESQFLSEGGNQFYGYAMVHQDDSESLVAIQQAFNFLYNSSYLGLGSNGRVWDRTNYYAELIMQGGTTLVPPVMPLNTRVDVKAHAFIGGLQYTAENDWHTQIGAELAMGSGDRDRLSVTDTFGGKVRPVTDENFLYYGAYDGGLALSPRLSNLIVPRASIQVKPLPYKGKDQPELSVGTTLSRYWKDEKPGAISDTLATLPSSDVGWGFDAFVGWRPLSDFSFYGQYGRFEPGDAYPVNTRDATNRVLLTATQSF